MIGAPLRLLRNLIVNCALLLRHLATLLRRSPTLDCPKKYIRASYLAGSDSAVYNSLDCNDVWRIRKRCWTCSSKGD